MTQTTTKKPRIALMGEFSSGKSTLANLFLEQQVSPVKVTATQLPPLWYVAGARAMVRIDLEGGEEALDTLDGVSPENTRAVRIALEADLLEHCELIDMPGSSDPNMPAHVWERLLDTVDGMIWCTTATQAWRQSEAALWEEIPARLHDRSMLLITKMDTLSSERDQRRVQARVARETEGMFRCVLPLSLTNLDAASECETLAGRDLLADWLMRIVEELRTGQPPQPIIPPTVSPAPPAVPQPTQSGAPANVIVPRRVVPNAARRRLTDNGTGAAAPR